MEVPASLAKPWLTQWAAQQERPPDAKRTANVQWKEELDWTGSFVSKLTRWQLTNGLMWLAGEEGTEMPPPKADNPESATPTATSFYPFFRLAEQANREYHFLHFYASLSSEAQASLCTKNLPLASLTPAQQQEAQWLSPLLRIALDTTPAEHILLGVGVKGGFNGKLGLVFSTADQGRATAN